VNVLPLGPNKFECVCENKPEKLSIKFSLTLGERVDYKLIAISLGDNIPENMLLQSMDFESETLGLFFSKVILNLFPTVYDDAVADGDSVS